MVGMVGGGQGKWHGSCFVCKRHDEDDSVKVTLVVDCRVGRATTGHDYSRTTIPGFSYRPAVSVYYEWVEVCFLETPNSIP